MKLKKCKVVAIPTNDKLPTMVTKSCTSGKFYFNKTLDSAAMHIEWESGIPVEIYVISEDEPLNDGGAIIEDRGDGPILQYHASYSMNENIYRMGKVIATTNLNLKLPSLSEDFIKRYCDKNGVDTVFVRYEDGKLYVKDDKISITLWWKN